ncbi:MAG: substrate-binding domain-containing protein [Spirochaetales bacterium]
MVLGLKGKFLYSSLFIFSFILALSPLLPAETRLRLATTTSVENSGLLEALLPSFIKQVRKPVDVIAVGSGAALTLGKRKDVDILLVQASSHEKQFMLERYGTEQGIGILDLEGRVRLYG